MKNLLRYCNMTAKQIAAELDKTASLSASESWLFLPENPKGKVCLVAHIDTVFAEHDKINRSFNCLTPVSTTPPQKQIFFDAKKGVLWSPDGLGADDRAGVWAALKLFKEIPEPYKPIVLLTDGEETGGTGAHEAATKFEEILEQVAFFIELDRKGDAEAVFYNWEPKEFTSFIKGFGFNESVGTFSDISIICPRVDKCGVNLSVGYENAHGKTEFLRIEALEKTVKAVPKILEAHHKDPQEWVLPSYTSYFESKYGADFEDDESFYHLCTMCDCYLTTEEILGGGSCPTCGEDLAEHREWYLEHEREAFERETEKQFEEVKKVQRVHGLYEEETLWDNGYY